MKRFALLASLIALIAYFYFKSTKPTPTLPEEPVSSVTGSVDNASPRTSFPQATPRESQSPTLALPTASAPTPTPRALSDLEIARAKWEAKNRPTKPATEVAPGDGSAGGIVVPLANLGGNGRKDRRENALGWMNTSRTPEDYRITIGPVPGEGEDPIATIEALNRNPRPWGSLVYVVDLDNALKKEVHVSALVKAEQVDAGMLWASASGEAFEEIAFEKAPFFQTFSWERFEVILNVPEFTRKFQFGVTLNGRQHVWIKDVRFEGK